MQGRHPCWERQRREGKPKARGGELAWAAPRVSYLGVGRDLCGRRRDKRSGAVSSDNDSGNVVLVLGGPSGPPARCGRQVQVTSASLALRQPVVTPAQEKYDVPAPREARPVPSSWSL